MLVQSAEFGKVEPYVLQELVAGSHIYRTHLPVAGLVLAVNAHHLEPFFV